jgi:hypothetical protein
MGLLYLYLFYITVLTFEAKLNTHISRKGKRLGTLYSPTVHRSILEVAVNENSVQQGIYVYGLSWALSEGGAISGFGHLR